MTVLTGFGGADESASTAIGTMPPKKDKPKAEPKSTETKETKTVKVGQRYPDRRANGDFLGLGRRRGGLCGIWLRVAVLEMRHMRQLDVGGTQIRNFRAHAHFRPWLIADGFVQVQNVRQRSRQ